MNEEAKKVIDDAEIQELLDSLDKDDTSNHGKRVLEASVVPITKQVKPRPGRPKKQFGVPITSKAEYNQAVIEQQVRFVERDDIVNAVVRRDDSASVLHALKERIARSAAALEFLRLEQQKRGTYNKELSQLISRQISALKDIANIELDIRKLGVDALDLSNPRLQEVFKLLIDTFRDAAKEVLAPAEFDLVWNKLETALEGWEEKADSLVR